MTDNIKIVREAVNKLWIKSNKYALTVASAKDVSGRKILLGINSDTKSQALTALDNLYDKAELIEWLEGQKYATPVFKGAVYKTDIYRRGAHNAQIEATLSKLKENG